MSTVPRRLTGRAIRSSRARRVVKICICPRRTRAGGRPEAAWPWMWFAHSGIKEPPLDAPKSGPLAARSAAGQGPRASRFVNADLGVFWVLLWLHDHIFPVRHARPNAPGFAQLRYMAEGGGSYPLGSAPSRKSPHQAQHFNKVELQGEGVASVQLLGPGW